MLYSFYFFTCFFIADATARSDSPLNRLRDSQADLIRIWLVIIAVGFFACTVIAAIKITPIKKTFICITKNGVYGSGGSSLYFASKSFNLSYNQITNISTFNDGIIIESGGETYKCLIESPIKTANAIRVKIGLPIDTSDKKQIYTSVKKSIDGTWLCPKCGLANKRNTNTCEMCGAVISDTPTETATANSNIWHCPNCGKANQNYVGMCGCGQKKP